MYTVYVLQSDDGRLYKGMTADLHHRLIEHKQRRVKTTKSFQNIEVIYTETCNNKIKARKREKYLKSAAGRRFIKKFLRW